MLFADSRFSLTVADGLIDEEVVINFINVAPADGVVDGLIDEDEVVTIVDGVVAVVVVVTVVVHLS